MSERISLAELRERAERGYGWGDGAILALVEAVEAAHAVTEAHTAVIEGVTPKHPNWCADDNDAYSARFSRWHATTRALRAALARFAFGERP